MSGFSSRRGLALMVGFNFAIGRVYVDVTLDLLDWRWQRPYADGGSYGVWIGPLWVDAWLIDCGETVGW